MTYRETPEILAKLFENYTAPPDAAGPRACRYCGTALVEDDARRAPCPVCTARWTMIGLARQGTRPSRA